MSDFKNYKIEFIGEVYAKFIVSHERAFYIKSLYDSWLQNKEIIEIEDINNTTYFIPTSGLKKSIMRIKQIDE